MNGVLDREDLVIEDTILDETLRCIRCQGPAAWRVANRCCGEFGYGCTPCERAWEAHQRAAFVLSAVFRRLPQCASCATTHTSFEEAFEVRAI